MICFRHCTSLTQREGEALLHPEEHLELAQYLVYLFALLSQIKILAIIFSFFSNNPIDLFQKRNSQTITYSPNCWLNYRY